MQLQELYPKLKNIPLIAKNIVEGFLSGLHRSPHHGFSVEFAEHRDYFPGDPLRHVDWKVYGRTDKMHIKKYEEETNVRSYFLLDTSSSMQYKGASKWNKLEFAALLMASLGYLAQKQIDGIAYGYFTDYLKSISPVKSTRTQLNQMIVSLEEQLQEAKNQKETTDLNKSLSGLANIINKRSLIYIISDFLIDPEALKETKDLLLELKHLKHEIILISVHDFVTEIAFNFDDGSYTFEDLESDLKVNLRSQDIKEEYKKQMQEHISSIKDFCNLHEIDLLLADISSNPEEILKNYLINRAKMM